MNDLLRILGDGLSIAALAIIAATAQGAWKRIPKGIAVPMLWDHTGEPSARAPKAVGLLAIPVVAIAVLLSFTLTQATFTDDPTRAIIIFLVRATLAASLALSQLFHLRFVIRTLQDEGQL
ncbi:MULTISPECIES: hypothetical protein [unclassified Caulobacter]|uniref:hypothetical protein n=1 Tax=unclassified Caulobacter TaxID=2648921 RepID=UPI0006F8A890|nr:MULTISPECIES: hypothetical protein [unclassified Caulobacter]KQV62327.1 hypothetical protein ASC62_01950 [Caulobacter sp. Root342]KQV65665.1 hypothetical protein ASC70_18350 [Caulobacter sp. Root343]